MPAYFLYGAHHSVAMSFPMIVYLSGMTMDYAWILDLLIKMKDPNDHATIDKIVDDIKDLYPDCATVVTY